MRARGVLITPSRELAREQPSPGLKGPAVRGRRGCGAPRNQGTQEPPRERRCAGLVGATGFEPATSSSRTKRATKLRYAPTMGREECGFSASGQGEMRRFVACVRIMFMGEDRASALSYKDRRGNEKTWWSGYYMQRFPAIPGWRVLGKAMIQVRLICS